MNYIGEKGEDRRKRRRKKKYIGIYPTWYNSGDEKWEGKSKSYGGVKCELISSHLQGLFCLFENGLESITAVVSNFYPIQGKKIVPFFFLFWHDHVSRQLSEGQGLTASTRAANCSIILNIE